jgi:TonB family protein
MDTSEHTVDKNKLDALFVEDRSIKRWLKDNRTGIYTAVAFHLLVFLTLTFNEIRKQTMPPKSIELIYHSIEPEEVVPEDETKKIEEELNQMLREMPTPDIRLPNLTMNAAAQGSESGRGQGAGASFFSSRNTASLREEKEKRESTRQTKKDVGIDDLPSEESVVEQEDGKAYSGPSVVSYYLDDRIAVYLPVPSYKCFRGGDVTVLIEVNAQGYVVGAEVDKRHSSTDECLHRAAIDAAERARFTTSQKGGTQKGNIVYRFVSQ